MPHDPLKYASDALGKAIETEKRNRKLLDSIGPAIIQALSPVLSRIESAVSKLKVDIQPKVIINPQVQIPEINIPDIQIPEINIPTPIVNYTPPEIKIPKIEMPEEMNIKGWVSLMGVDLEHPLPVQLRNADGSPFNPFENLTTILGGGGGGSKHVKIDGTVPISAGDSLVVQQLSGAVDSVIVNDVLVTVGVNQVSGANWSVSVADTVTVNQLSGANWSVTASATDLDIRDINVTQDEILVHQVSGSSWSVAATQVTSPWVVSATDLDIRDLDFATDDVSTYQVSGHRWSTEATQSGTWNIGTVTTVSTVTAVTDVTNSVRVLALPETLQTQLADITTSVQTLDNAISGSEMQVDVITMPTVTVTGSLTSVVATGAVLHDAADDGHAPVKQGGHAIQTNPTAVADGDITRIVTDDLGRTLTRPVQVRDLIATAYISLTGGTETTLLAASAGAYHDLIYIMGTNNSDAAVTADIRAVTAGNIMTSIRIPANGTAGVSLPVPIPQDATGNNWTADLPDISGTTVTLSALFSKEV